MSKIISPFYLSCSEAEQYSPGAPRLPPIDTSEYISCPIDTPLSDFDQSSPLPCIIVTPSSPTEYHIAFHHKSSPLKYSSFAAQQQQQLRRQHQRQPPRARRPLLTLDEFVAASPPANVIAFDIEPPRRPLLNPRMRTALVLAVPLFIVVCHILARTLMRLELSGTLFGGRVSRGGFSSAAAHMRAQRNPQPLPDPQTHGLHALN